jgi:hypothetical protein
VPPIDKALRREEQRRKARDGKTQNVRYRTIRSGESLVAFESARKTTLEGKPMKKIKRRKRG